MVAPALLAAGACTSIAADAATFDNTRWQVTAINGRATPAVGDYQVQFRDGGIGGRFGCNSMGGRYSVAGDVMTVRDLASTLMGCPEPAMTFETQGAAVLNQPMRIVWSSGRQLTLSNAAGSITLKQVR